MSGAIGAIGTFYNLWGAECQAARRAAVAGDVTGSAQFMSRFQLAISRCLRSGGIWSFLRRAMQLKHQHAVRDQPALDLEENRTAGGLGRPRVGGV